MIHRCKLRRFHISRICWLKSQLSAYAPSNVSPIFSDCRLSLIIFICDHFKHTLPQHTNTPTHTNTNFHLYKTRWLGRTWPTLARPSTCPKLSSPTSVKLFSVSNVWQSTRFGTWSPLSLPFFGWYPLCVSFLLCESLSCAVSPPLSHSIELTAMTCFACPPLFPLFQWPDVISASQIIWFGQSPKSDRIRPSFLFCAFLRQTSFYSTVAYHFTPTLAHRHTHASLSTNVYIYIYIVRPHFQRIFRWFPCHDNFSCCHRFSCCWYFGLSLFLCIRRYLVARCFLTHFACNHLVAQF